MSSAKAQVMIYVSKNVSWSSVSTNVGVYRNKLCTKLLVPSGLKGTRRLQLLLSQSITLRMPLRVLNCCWHVLKRCRYKADPVCMILSLAICVDGSMDQPCGVPEKYLQKPYCRNAPQNQIKRVGALFTYNKRIQFSRYVLATWVGLGNKLAIQMSFCNWRRTSQYPFWPMCFL